MDNDKLIIERLGEHKRKLNILEKFLNSRNDKRRTIHKVLLSSMAAAAVIALILLLAPSIFAPSPLDSLHLQQPQLAQYRGADIFDDIEKDIASGNYSHALELADQARITYQSELERACECEPTDEVKYQISLYNAYLEDIAWTQIYLFYMTKDKDALTASCEAYLKHPDYQEYRAQVENILLILQK